MGKVLENLKPLLIKKVLKTLLGHFLRRTRWRN